MLYFFVKKISSALSRKYTLLCLSIIALFQASVAFSFDNIQNIELSALGNFKVSFSTINKVDFIDGQSLLGEVSFKHGENYSFTFPFDVQRIRYHINNGDKVKQGGTVATVEGYDVHHFIDEYKSAKKLLDASENHFLTNKSYFENKTIKSSQWVEISKKYFEAKLNFEHLHHKMSFLHIDKNDNVTFISPKGGILKIPNIANSSLEGDLAFDVIDENSIQVKVSTPLLYTSSLAHLKVSSNCFLTIDSVEKIADKYHQTLWASPHKTSSCNLTLGQLIKVIPVQHFDGYKINKSAIFEFEDKNYIAVKSNEVVSLIAINLFGSHGNEYYFTAKKDIQNKEGLVSSVSILQGKLLSLGAE